MHPSPPPPSLTVLWPHIVLHSWAIFPTDSTFIPLSTTHTVHRHLLSARLSLHCRLLHVLTWAGGKCYHMLWQHKVWDDNINAHHMTDPKCYTRFYIWILTLYLVLTYTDWRCATVGISFKNYITKLKILKSGREILILGKAAVR